MPWRRNPNRGVPEPYTTWDEYYANEAPPSNYKSWEDYWEDNLVAGGPGNWVLEMIGDVVWRLRMYILIGLGITLLLFVVC